MNFYTILAFVNLVTTGFIFTIWSKSNLLNITIKILFLVLLVVNFFNFLFQIGFVIHQ